MCPVLKHGRPGKTQCHTRGRVLVRPKELVTCAGVLMTNSSCRTPHPTPHVEASLLKVGWQNPTPGILMDTLPPRLHGVTSAFQKVPRCFPCMVSAGAGAAAPEASQTQGGFSVGVGLFCAPFSATQDCPADAPTSPVRGHQHPSQVLRLPGLRRPEVKCDSAPKREQRLRPVGEGLTARPRCI